MRKRYTLPQINLADRNPFSPQFDARVTLSRNQLIILQARRLARLEINRDVQRIDGKLNVNYCHLVYFPLTDVLIRKNVFI